MERGVPLILSEDISNEGTIISTVMVYIGIVLRCHRSPDQWPIDRYQPLLRLRSTATIVGGSILSYQQLKKNKHLLDFILLRRCYIDVSKQPAVLHIMFDQSNICL